MTQLKYPKYNLLFGDGILKLFQNFNKVIYRVIIYTVLFKIFQMSFIYCLYNISLDIKQ